MAGTAVVLSAPASDEVPLLLRNFLESAKEESLLICKTLSSAENLARPENVKALVCSDKPTSPARNIIPGKGIENLTELNIAIADASSSLQPKRLVIDILSDILLRHKALQTRRWLTELLERLRAKGITTYAVLNPYMHAAEETQAVTDLFDGSLEIIEKQTDDGLKKFLQIKWMHGIDSAEKEFPLTDLVNVGSVHPQQVTVAFSPLKEPRWQTPLVSRTAELARLKTAFDDSLAGKSSVVALQGEAGVGKTRLMQELAVYAQSKNAVVLSGSAFEEGLPYAPWVDVSRQYVAQSPAELMRRLLGNYASEFARLVPDISAKLGTIPPSKPLEEQQDKIRLFEAVTQFLVGICKDAPLVLLLDDMQYADRASLDLLEYFARNTSNKRVLTVCSSPIHGESETSSPLEQAYMKLNKQRVLESITVRNLEKNETVGLIKEVFGSETVTPEFADLVYQRTGGNPFFIEEILRALVEDGTIFKTTKGWDRKPIHELAVPRTVKSSLKTRLTKLDNDMLSLLTTASIIGVEFNLGVLREVTQTQENTLLDKLETAINAGLLVEIPNLNDVFRFADHRIRDVLLDDVIRSKRIRNHVKIAQAMEKLYSDNLEVHAEAIANHYSEGGDTQQAVKYSVMAGDRSRQIHAYEPAISNYKRALDLIDLQSDREEERASILEKLGECYLAVQPAEAESCYEKALGVYDKLGSKESCTRACLKLAEAVYKNNPAHIEQALIFLRRGLKYIEEAPESFEAASVYARLAWYVGILDRWEEATTWADKALEVGEKSQNSAAVCAGLMIRGSFLTDTGRIDEGLPLWERAFETALRHEHYAEALFSLGNIGVYTYPRSLLRARELADRRLDLSKRLNDMVSQAESLWALAFISWLEGDWTTALDEYHRAMEIRERVGLPSEGAEPLWFQLNRDLTQEEEQLKTLSQIYRESSKISWTVFLNLQWGLLRVEQGRAAEARAHFEAAVDAFRKWEFTTFPIDHIETLLHLTELYCKDGELERARNMTEWARRIAEQLKSDAAMGLAYQAQGSLLSAAGESKEAEEAYQNSLNCFEKAGWVYYHAKALVSYSSAMSHSKPAESSRRLEQAAEIFRKLGAKRALEKAEAKLSDHA